MTTEDVVRAIGTLITAVGLALLVGTLAGAYGWLAAGALLLVVGALVVVPLYRRKFDADSAARETAKARQGREEFRGVPPPTAAASSAEEGGGQSFPLPG
jgi:hypothetical protein